VIGLYWIAVAIVSKRAAASEASTKSRWGLCILPWLLSLDNFTYGAVDGVSNGASIWLSALEQALSSVIQAGLGLAIGIAIAYSIPALRRRMWPANGVAGGRMLVAAGVLHAVG
jgi:putative Mn2+ efflux pump MntP